MKVFKQLFDFYINSNLHVSLAVISLVVITFLNFHLVLDIDLLFFMFFATITAYNFVRYFGLAKFHHRSLASWLKPIQIFSFLCFLVLVYFTFQLDEKTLLYLGGLGVITFFYAVPFLPKKVFVDSKMNLRAISGLKIYVIAFVWAVATVVIPIINEKYPISNDVILTIIQRYLFIIIAMLPFEIRDMQFDSLKLATIPQRIGIRQTKIIGIILIIPFCLLEYFKDDINYQNLTMLFIIAILLFWFLLFSKINQSQYYTSFWIEGIPIIWLGLSLV